MPRGSSPKPSRPRMVKPDAFISLLCWATRRFSSTVMPENRRMFWKVRATFASAVILKSGMRSSRNCWPSPRRMRDHALRRLVEAGDAVEHGRLAGAVRADQRGDLAAPGLEGQVVDGHEAAELHRQMLDRQDGVVLHGCSSLHQPWPSLVKAARYGSCARTGRRSGSRLPTKPRGFQSITMTMARPKSSMR